MRKLMQKLRDRCWRKRVKCCGCNVDFGRPSMILGLQNMVIGNDAHFNDGIWLTAWDGEMVIGDNCRFGAYNHISCANRIEIGDNFLSGKWVTIIDNSHGTTDMSSLMKRPADRGIFSKGSIIIGKNVWVGDKATILPGCAIGDNVVIGANSVVTKDIPSFSVVVGNPGRIVKQLVDVNQPLNDSD